MVNGKVEKHEQEKKRKKKKKKDRVSVQGWCGFFFLSGRKEERSVEGK